MPGPLLTFEDFRASSCQLARVVKGVALSFYCT